jgi:hypothetical protein
VDEPRSSGPALGGRSLGLGDAKVDDRQSEIAEALGSAAHAQTKMVPRDASRRDVQLLRRRCSAAVVRQAEAARRSKRADPLQRHELGSIDQVHARVVVPIVQESRRDHE